jgi:2-dehydropantoate 2-reductase
MQQNGLVVRSARGDLHLQTITATDDPASLTPPDIVLFAVKLWDTESAARQIRPLVRPGTAVISFQNGVQKEEVLAGIFGAEAVIGGTSQIGVAIERPGVVAHVGTMAKLTFGEMDGSRSARAEAFLAACEAAGIDAELTDDIQLRLWEKFVFLTAVSGCTSAMRQTIGPIRSNPQTRAFLLDLMCEVVELARARGIALPEDYAEQRLAFIDGLPETMTSSMQVDLSRGNKLEVPWLSGAVAELAKQSGTAAPLNRAVADILAPYANGSPQAGSP